LIMSNPDLDAIDPAISPLLEAIGRAVLGAAALERVLLVDIAQRRARNDGLGDELREQLARLETKPAGTLLATLRRLGMTADLATRTEDVVRRRNRLVHHFLDDPQTLTSLTNSEGVGALVDRVDALAADCQSLINDIAPIAFSGAEQVLGFRLRDFFEVAHGIDIGQVGDPLLRAQLELARSIDPDELDPA
jgi:hypothetical protein